MRTKNRATGRPQTEEQRPEEVVTVNQAVEATSTEQAALNTAVTTDIEQEERRLKQQLAELRELKKKTKTAKVKTPCAKAGCKLFACEGGQGFCSNHRPLNNDELDFAATLAQGMNGESLINLLGDQRIRMMFRNQQSKS